MLTLRNTPSFGWSFQLPIREDEVEEGVFRKLRMTWSTSVGSDAVSPTKT